MPSSLSLDLRRRIAAAVALARRYVPQRRGSACRRRRRCVWDRGLGQAKTWRHARGAARRSVWSQARSRTGSGRG